MIGDKDARALAKQKQLEEKAALAERRRQAAQGAAQQGGSQPGGSHQVGQQNKP